MILTLYWIFFKFELERLFFIFLGTLARKYSLFTGSTIHHFAPVFLWFIIPLDNISTFWNLDLSKLGSSILLLTPIWVWKLTIAAVIGYIVVEFMLDIPIYFRMTFIALLVSEPIFEQTNSVSGNLCFLVDRTAPKNRFYLDIDCKGGGRDGEFLKLLNSFVSFLVIPIFLKMDRLVYQKVGKTIIWVDNEAYFS